MRECVFEGNAECADGQPSEYELSDPFESSKEQVHPVSSSRTTRAKEMSDPPVSFVVGDPESNSDLGPDPSEVQEIEDSFPDEGSDSNYMQMQGAIMPGPSERRKRLR
jgi:hypothetical protein